MLDGRQMIYQNAIALIGHTPLIELSNLPNHSGRILAKLEYLNPGGSIKDRAALAILKNAYQEKKLHPKQTVVEMTSGNMGSGLAIVCHLFGNPFVAVMSQGNSPARLKMLKDLGAEVILVPQVDGDPLHVTGKDIEAAVQCAKEIAQQRNAFYVDQFNHWGSILAHENGTGPEIWQDTQGVLHAFVAAVGSGGTFIGCSRFLKSKNPAIYCAAVEPTGAEVLAGKPITHSKHIMQGMGYSFIPPHWDKQLADDFISVSCEEAKFYQQLLATQEGLYVGYSSGANVCAAIKLLEKNILPSNSTIVTILCDHGLKY